MKLRSILLTLLLALTLTAGAATYKSYVPVEGDPPIVVVHWEDITYTPAWEDSEEEYGTTELYTVGWLIEDTEDEITIAGTWDETNGVFAEFNTFPKAPIHSVTVVQP